MLKMLPLIFALIVYSEQAYYRCPPQYQWVTCNKDKPFEGGCDRTCEKPNDECAKRCLPRCACPPERPYLHHGFCKPECPGRRFAPIIIQGLSNRNLPEGGEFTVTCTAIGEPVPEMKISGYEYQPALKDASTYGQLGLKTSTKTYKARRGVTPDVVTCVAWNINGVAESSATYKIITQDDTMSNPALSSNGELKMAPLVRLGIESLVLGNMMGQRMKCIVTGAPKPHVEIVEVEALKTAKNIAVSTYAEPGLHEVTAELIVIVDASAEGVLTAHQRAVVGPDQRTRQYVCVASNKYGTVRDVATLSYADKGANPSEAGLIIQASGFVRSPVVVGKWPFTPTENQCLDHLGNKHKLYDSWKQDCNTCTCMKNGNAFCTSKPCGCLDDEGNKHKLYDSWKQDCNTCTCMKRGNVFCTSKPCQCLDDEGNEHKLYDSWKQDCNTCTCMKRGNVFCTSKECRKPDPVCKSHGATIKLGDVVKVDCNQCVCMSGGVMRCSKNDCTPKPVVPTGIQCNWFGGVKYNIGDTFMHGCKKCTCHESGRPYCVDPGNCGVMCNYRNGQLPIGTVFKENCKTCTCNKDGRVTCEGDECVSEKIVGCVHNGKSYSLFERFKDDCNNCACLRTGAICTKNVCMVPKNNCTFQKVRELVHGTVLQVECNICKCNDGEMQCTTNTCQEGIKYKDIVGCQLEGEQRKYRFGSVIQLGRKACKCESVKGEMEFVCS